MAHFEHILGPLKQQIAEFEKRIEDDGLDYCTSLYEEAEIMVMACKYAYYVMNAPFKSDVAYDICENSWYVMGRALGDLEEDVTSPCIGWDSGQRSASKARELAQKLMKK